MTVGEARIDCHSKKCLKLNRQCCFNFKHQWKKYSMGGHLKGGSICPKCRCQFTVPISFQIQHSLAKDAYQSPNDTLRLTIGMWMIKCNFSMVYLKSIRHFPNSIQEMSPTVTTRILGHPNLEIIFSYLNKAAWAAVLVLTALVSAHLVKYSVATTI